MPRTKMDDTYVYGPITQEEFENLKVNHRMTVISNQIYIGVNVELEEFADRYIPRPTQVEQPTEE